MDLKSKFGYKRDSPFKDNKSMLINTPNGQITMNKVDIPLLARGVNSNETKILMPNSGEHFFNDTEVLEIPLKSYNDNMNYKYQNGGSTNENMGSWIYRMIASNQIERLPASVKAEISERIPNPSDITSISDSSLKDILPNTFQYYNNSVGVEPLQSPSMSRNINTMLSGNSSTKLTGMPELSQEPAPETGKVPLEYKAGGKVERVSDVINNYIEHTILPESNTIQPFTKIKYKSGGVIKEGVVKSYNPFTGKYTLY